MRKIKFNDLISLFAFFIFVSGVEAREVLRSSVSPEFRNGLQEKYLHYLAEKASMDLKIYPMPISRRIRALKQGEIDIMVSISDSLPENDDFYKLSPSYEQISSQYFLRSEDVEKLSSRKDLKKLIVGMTIDKQARFKWLEQDHFETIYVGTLEQKIELLTLGRIDSFLHFEQSAQRVIELKGLNEKISIAPFQSGVTSDYYFAISTKSPLYKNREKFEVIIKQGVESKDFQRIREAHYGQKL